MVPTVEGGFCSEGRLGMQEEMAPVMEGGFGFEEEAYDSKVQKKYLAKLDVALAEFKVEDEHMLPQRHYYIPRQSIGEDEHG
jgi:hypothetical protein